MYKILVFLFLLLWSVDVNGQQTPVCPTTSNASPQFTAVPGGTLFNRLWSQWNQYFQSKVDANNGTLCNPNIGNINIDNGTITNGLTVKSGTIKNVPAPQNGGDVTNKTYVDSKITGLIPEQNVVWATAGSPLPNSPSYNNGASGVGATLQANVINVPLVVDGNTVNLNDRVLVKDQVNQTQNGVFYLSQAAGPILPWLLTRVNDWNQAIEMVPNSNFVVTNGAVNSSSAWNFVCPLPCNVVVGQSQLTFNLSQRSQIYVADEVSLHLTGNVFSTKNYLTSSKTANYTILATDTGQNFDNGGATGEVDFTLPNSTPGMHYCFDSVVAQPLKIIAFTGEQITVGTFVSTVTGSLTLNAPYSRICIHAPNGNPTVWISDSTPVGSWILN